MFSTRKSRQSFAFTVLTLNSTSISVRFVNLFIVMMCNGAVIEGL